MKKILLAGLLATTVFVVPAKALTVEGVDYSLINITGINTSTFSATLHITGINVPGVDTEGGRSAVEAFAFSTVGFPIISGSAAGFLFQTGGLNADGCNGDGGFVCFSAGELPNTPALAANSVLDFPFTLDVSSGTFEGWSPSFKIYWAGCKNENCTANFDNVSQTIAVPGPIVGAGIPGLIAA